MNTATRGTFLYSFYFLRCLAALAVLCHHALTAFGPPLISITLLASSVDMFFVLSGAAIGLVDPNDSAYVFIARRAVRLFPLYWGATLFYLIAQYFLFRSTPEFGDVLHSLFFIPDFTKAYWYPIYFPGWTLSYEVAFYILFGLVLAWSANTVRLTAAIICTALAIIPVPVPFISGATFNTQIGLEFALGLLIVEAVKRGYRPAPVVAGLSICTGMVVLGIWYNESGTQRAIHWGIPAAMIVFGILGFEDKAFWRKKFFILCGDSVYSIYLAHATILGLLNYTLDNSGSYIKMLLPYSFFREILLVFVTYAIGVLIYIIVQRPVDRALRSAFLPVARQIREDSSAYFTPAVHDTKGPAHRVRKVTVVDGV